MIGLSLDIYVKSLCSLLEQIQLLCVSGIHSKKEDNGDNYWNICAQASTVAETRDKLGATLMTWHLQNVRLVTVAVN